jgi:hypothetical protein
MAFLFFGATDWTTDYVILRSLLIVDLTVWLTEVLILRLLFLFPTLLEPKLSIAVIWLVIDLFFECPGFYGASFGFSNASKLAN